MGGFIAYAGVAVKSALLILWAGGLEVVPLSCGRGQKRLM